MLKELGRGQAGTVYLARHIGLDTLRAIKCISKDNERFDTFHKEAYILKSLHHPGIPVIYDIEEDISYAYIIEEYLQGESIISLIERLGSLSRQMLLHYGIQLCLVIYYLHSAKPQPIIHLDLKPNNLIISDGIIKLFDFGNAASVKEANAVTKRYGTVGCAAPEQYTEESIDERTDIYAIGVILYYLGSGHFPGATPSFEYEAFDMQLIQIINCCLEQNKNNRYPSVGELCEKLKKLQVIYEKDNQSFKLSSLKIAVIGSKSGAGTTHFAFGLTYYMTNKGIPCIYEEHNSSGAVMGLSRYDHKVKEELGIYSYKGCSMLPLYGNCVSIDTSYFPFHILDFGCDIQRVEEIQDQIQFVIFISGTKAWEISYLEKMAKSLKFFKSGVCILNYFIGTVPKNIYNEGIFGTIFLMPYYPNPWIHNKEITCFYERIIDLILPNGKGGVERRKVSKGFFGKKVTKPIEK